jgi:hypothetical protein
MRNLIKKGWLARLVGGRYMLLPPEYGPENLGEHNPIARVVDGFRFLEDLTDLERNLARDDGRRKRADVEALRDDVKGRVGAH